MRQYIQQVAQEDETLQLWEERQTAEATWNIGLKS